MNEIIDFEREGHLIRLYLGKNGKQWGDDWDDVPYEHNAGAVYDEFVKGYADIVVPFEKVIAEPSASDHSNSRFSKKHMIGRVVPCLMFCDEEVFPSDYWDTVQNSDKIYFGDKLDEVLERIPYLKQVN